MAKRTDSGFGGRASGRAPIGAEARLVCAPDGRGGFAVRGGDVLRITGRPYVTREGEVPDAAIYRVAGARPETEGPWLGEADKVAWLDEGTGYECLFLRGGDGALGGYVGVTTSHPLHGWSSGALAGLGLDAHDGVSYAAVCEGGSEADGSPPRARRDVEALHDEATRICHVERSVGGGDRHAWWFGFVCDGRHDLVPRDVGDVRTPTGIGVDRVYRNDAYVIAQVRHLAAQLRAIADGGPMPVRRETSSSVADRSGRGGR